MLAMLREVGESSHSDRSESVMDGSGRLGAEMIQRSRLVRGLDEHVCDK